MHQLLGGQRRPGRGARPLDVVEPATGEVLAEIDTASPADVDDAVAAATEAAPERPVSEANRSGEDKPL